MLLTLFFTLIAIGSALGGAELIYRRNYQGGGALVGLATAITIICLVSLFF